MKSIFKLGILGLFTLGLMIGCNSDEKPSGDTTPLTIKITDAPANFDAIFLNIDEIEFRTSGGKVKIDIDDNPFDILQYRFGKDTILANHDVASGMLQEIRLKLEDNGNTVIINGQSHPLTTPSGQSSGVKIKIQEELIPNVAYTILLDFDASKSIVQAGNGKYLLKPVIRAVPVATSGAIFGKALPLDAYPRIYAINGIDTIGTIPNDLGDFYLAGVPEGTYKILFEPSIAPYVPTTLENIVVKKGFEKDLGTITLNTH